MIACFVIGMLAVAKVLLPAVDEWADRQAADAMLGDRFLEAIEEQRNNDVVDLVARYGRDLPPVFSGQNELYVDGPPPQSRDLVLNVMNRHPAVVARMASTLQVASGGRLVLGIGIGGALVDGAHQEFLNSLWNWTANNLSRDYFGSQGMLGYVLGVQRQEIRQGIACVLERV